MGRNYSIGEMAILKSSRHLLAPVDKYGRLIDDFYRYFVINDAFTTIRESSNDRNLFRSIRQMTELAILIYLMK